MKKILVAFVFGIIMMVLSGCTVHLEGNNSHIKVTATPTASSSQEIQKEYKIFSCYQYPATITSNVGRVDGYYNLYHVSYFKEGPSPQIKEIELNASNEKVHIYIGEENKFIIKDKEYFLYLTEDFFIKSK